MHGNIQGSCSVAEKSNVSVSMPCNSQQQQHRFNSQCDSPEEYNKTMVTRTSLLNQGLKYARQAVSLQDLLSKCIQCNRQSGSCSFLLRLFTQMKNFIVENVDGYLFHPRKGYKNCRIV